MRTEASHRAILLGVCLTGTPLAAAAQEPATTTETPAASDEASAAPEVPGASAAPQGDASASYMARYQHVAADHAAKADLLINAIHTLHWPGLWGGGVEGVLMIPHLVHVTAELGYGLRLPPPSSDSGKGSTAPYVQLFAGYPLRSWVSNKHGGLAVSQERGADTISTQYVNIDVPAHDTLVVEGGLMAVPVGSYTLAAGARWLSFYQADIRMTGEEGDYTASCKQLFNLAAYLLVGTWGPDAEVVYDDEDLGTGVGFMAKLSYPAWLNGLATVDATVGRAPAGDWYFHVGNTFPLVFLDFL